jgi:hypothetical protein
VNGTGCGHFSGLKKVWKYLKHRTLYNVWWKNILNARYQHPKIEVEPFRDAVEEHLKCKVSTPYQLTITIIELRWKNILNARYQHRIHTEGGIRHRWKNILNARYQHPDSVINHFHDRWKNILNAR